jgi:hypothetical protein
MVVAAMAERAIQAGARPKEDEPATSAEPSKAVSRADDGSGRGSIDFSQL